MSVNNPAEAEMRELVAKTLEEKGVLGKVKVMLIDRCLLCIYYVKLYDVTCTQAQLRASVFLALQEQETSTVSITICSLSHIQYHNRN